MENISIYLEKFKNYGFEKIKIKEVVISVFKDNLGVVLDRKDIDFNGENIRINLSGSKRSEFFINKNLIQKEVVKRLGSDKDFKDIL